MAACSRPRRQVASGVRTAAMSRSGLCGARFVAKTGPWTTTSQAPMWTQGRSGVSTVTRSSPSGAPARAARSYARYTDDRS